MKEERKNAIKKPALLLGLSFIALGCTLGISSFSWFSLPQNSATLSGITGEATGSYFEDGDGSESDPYLIVSAKQLYYFAWLQDMGYFNETDSTSGEIPATYFKLGKDIDASGYVLPPCGIEKYPFLGNFDGNNCTVSNLTIANCIEDSYIKTYPSMLDTDNTRLKKAEFNSSQGAIVGFFGIIGQYNSIPTVKYSSSTNEVKNLYLDELTIKTSKSNLLVGIFAGYANGVIDNCGVHYAEMDINGATSKIDGKFNFVSEYTLIGSYNKDAYKWDQDTTGGGSGSDTGYGTSTDIKSLHVSLINNGLKDSTGTIGQIPLKTVLPFRYASTSLVYNTESKSVTAVSNYGTKSLTIKSNEYATYAASSKGNNLGYYSGVIETLEQTLDYNVSDFGSGNFLKTPPDNVLTYLKNNGTHLLRFTNGDTGQYLYQRNFAYVENAVVGSTKGSLIIPANGIWVAPKESGKFRFVFYNPGYASKKTVGVDFWVLKRITVGDYSGAFDGYNSMNSEVPYSCKYGYFEYTASTNYEYFIGFSTQGNSSPYIAYMDIGAESGDGDGESETDTRTLISDFDFVTKENGVLTKIKNADGSEIAGNTYTKSNVFFEIGDAEASRTMYWRRTTIDNETIVLYYPSSSSSALTTAGTGSSGEASDEKCTGKKAS